MPQNTQQVISLLLTTTFIMVALIMRPVASYGQEVSCPAGYKCVPNEIAQGWRLALEQQHCMDAALGAWESSGGGDKSAADNLSLTFPEPYQIIMTRERSSGGGGQVFDQEYWVALLKWCGYEVEFKVRPNVRVLMKEEDDDESAQTWGFRLRVRLGLNFSPYHVYHRGGEVAAGDAGQSWSAWLSPALLLEPFYVYDFHTAVYISPQSFGLVLGMDVTRNLDVYAGVGGAFFPAGGGGGGGGWGAVIPVLGLSLSFN